MRASTRVVTVALAVMLTLTATVSHAAWTASSTTTSRATNASIGITVGGAAASYAFTTLNVTAAMPGSVAMGSVAVKNTGGVPQTIGAATATSGDLAAHTSVWMWDQDASVCTTPTSPRTGTLVSTSFSSTTPIAPGATRYLCVRTVLDASAPSVLAGASVSPTISIVGTSTLGTATSRWTSNTVTATFTQSVSAVRAATVQALTCRTVTPWGWGVIPNGQVTLSWTAPANTPQTGLTYSLYDMRTGAPIVEKITTRSHTFTLATDALTQPFGVEVRTNSGSMWQSTGAAATVLRNSSEFLWVDYYGIKCA